MTTLLLTLALAAGQAPKPADAKAVELVLEDQFGRRQDIAAYRGDVVLLVYGDRRATDACRELGEKLHVLFHPSAAGQPPAKAKTAPVAPLAGVPAGARSPDVVVTPVAVPGQVPGAVRELLRTQIKLASPEVPVWLDFTGTMQKQFDLRPGQPNIALFDARGRLRLKVNGTPDKPAMDQLLQLAQNLRAEAAGLAK
jgi:hypothetical protein